MKKNDKEKLHLNLKISKRSDSISSEKYLKYKVDDSESNISEDDIETKMNRLIQIKKAIKSKKVDSESIGYERMKKEAEKFKKKQKEHKDKKNIDNTNKIKEGLKVFEAKYKKIIKKNFFKKLIKKVKGKENIKKGYEKIELLYKQLKKIKRKEIFKNLKLYWRKKKRRRRKKKKG